MQQALLFAPPVPISFPAFRPRRPAPARRAPFPGSGRLEDRQFAAMELAFARHGGLATADGVARLMRCRSSQPISTLARWIVDRRAVNIAWHGQTLLPMFQFDRESMALQAGVGDVVAELAHAFDDWELALWFAAPNSWLGDAAPVDRLHVEQPAVLDAARADRFIALG